MKNVLSAFKRSGLFPFNPGAKPDYIYITPPKVYLEDEIAVIQNSQCVGKNAGQGRSGVNVLSWQSN